MVSCVVGYFPGRHFPGSYFPLKAYSGMDSGTAVIVVVAAVVVDALNL